MVDQKKLDKSMQRIFDFSDTINEFLIKECTKHAYNVQELYITVKYILKKFELSLGPEKCKQLDNTFYIPDTNKEGIC